MTKLIVFLVKAAIYLVVASIIAVVVFWIYCIYLYTRPAPKLTCPAGEHRLYHSEYDKEQGNAYMCAFDQYPNAQEIPTL